MSKSKDSEHSKKKSPKVDAKSAATKVTPTELVENTKVQAKESKDSHGSKRK